MKKLCLLIACFSTLFAQDNKVVEWGEEAFFKKTWPEAVLFCMENNQALPNSNEVDKLENPVKYWEIDSNYYLDYKRTAKCVKNSDANMSNMLNSANTILKACRNDAAEKEVEEKKREEADTKKSIGDKFKSLGEGIVDVGGRAAKATVGVGISVIPGGQVVGGQFLNSAFEFNSSSNYPVLNKEVCENIYIQTKRIGQNNNNPLVLSK